MDNSENAQPKYQNPDLHGLYSALSEILDEFNLEYDQFTKTLRKYYVREAYKDCQTVARTALKCGVDRRLVSEIIKDTEKQYSSSPLHQILNEMELMAQSNDMTVEKLGDESIQSIMLKLASGSTTVNSIVDQLVAQGCIEDLGENIRFIENNFNKSDNKRLQHLSSVVQQATQGLLNQ